MYQALMYPELKLLLEENDVAGMAEFCEVLHPAVTAEVLEKLDPAEAWKVLKTSNLERQVEILEYMSLPGQVDLVNVIDRKRLTRLLEEMSPDDRVDLLSRMQPEKVENLLPSIAQAERNDIRRLAQLPGAQCRGDYDDRIRFAAGGHHRPRSLGPAAPSGSESGDDLLCVYHR